MQVTQEIECRKIRISSFHWVPGNLCITILKNEALKLNFSKSKTETTQTDTGLKI